MQFVQRTRDNVNVRFYMRLYPRGNLIIISNGNRSEWNPIWSVIMRVINKSGSPICLITSMITDRIGRHEVLLPINHNFNKMCDIIGYFLNQNTRNSKLCFASSEKKKPFKQFWLFTILKIKTNLRNRLLLYSVNSPRVFLIYCVQVVL